MTYSGKEILDTLGLNSYHPSKLSYHEASKIRKDITPGYDHRCDGITLVNRLLKSDFSALEEITSTINKGRGTNQDDASGSHQNTSSNRLFTLRNRVASKEKQLNPMDVMTVVLRCSDDFLRSVLVGKLVSAKVGVPILLEQVHDQDLVLPMVLNSSLRKPVTELPDSITKQKHLVNIANPIISFIRVGNLYRSKSKLLSSFLNKTNPNAFFHRESSNASSRRSLSNGSIEVAWFESATDSDNDYDFGCNFFTILNLRGDARDFPKQTKLLCESSSLVVVMIDSVASLSSLSEQAYDEICWDSVKIAIAVVSENSSQCIDDLEIFSTTSPLFQHVTGMHVTFDCNDDNTVMNFLEWRTDMRELCKQFINTDQNLTYFTLEEYFKRAKSMGFAVEDDKEIFDSMNNSVKAFASYLCENRLAQEVYPLQGEPFQKIAEIEKRKMRGYSKAKESSDEFFSQIDIELKLQRKKQCRLISQLTESVRAFYIDLHSLRGNDFVNSIASLNLGLDAQFGSKDETIQLENIMRELGQIYEAMMHSKQDLEFRDSKRALQFQEIREFASKAAELLILGEPLELLNGDASYAPKQWLKAVFKGVAYLTNNGKIFVLSVIGVQSSGKSTLLNALFGLHFPTSAGQCTRGLYCHLLAIDKTTVKTEYDFVMVLDVEGFRAPEYADSYTVRDNEMATFIVGLSDLTIVNIEGENSSQMHDILQIVVYALLRIKQTKHNIKFMPSCVFVHQKISAQNFNEKTQSGRQLQIKFLDEMVKSSAQKEGYSNIEAFGDVVIYNDKEDSYTLPNIWIGNPPFTTVSPGYCRDAAMLKSDLIKKIEKRPSCLKIDDLHIKISDLWDAILRENFVFNFRCTREVLAYQSISAIFLEIEWNLRNSMLKVVTKVINKILSIGSCEKLDEIKMQLFKEIRQNHSKISSESEESLEKVLSSIQYEDIASKFRDTYKRQLEYLKLEEQRKAKEVFEKTLSIQRKKLENYKVIESKVKRMVADILRNRKSARYSRLMVNIDRTWEKEFEVEERNYKKRIENAVKSIKCLVVRYFSIDAPNACYRPKDEMKFPEVTHEDIIPNAIRFRENTDEILPMSTANQNCRKLFDDCMLRLESFNGLEFDETHLEPVFRPILEYFGMNLRGTSENFQLSKEIANYPTETTDVGLFESSYRPTLKRDYVVKYLAFTGYHVFNKLKLTKENFISTTNAYVVLKSQYMRKVKAIISQEKEPEFMLAEYILSAAELTAIQSLGLVVSKILGDHDAAFKNKKAFMAKLLADLASKEDFASFTEFFSNYDEFFKKQLRYYIQTSLEDDTVRSKIMCCINEDIGILIKNVQQDIIDSLEDCSPQDSPQKWLCTFRAKLSGKITFNPEEILVWFLHMSDRSEDVDNLQKLAKTLNSFLDKLFDINSYSESSTLWEKVKMEDSFVKQISERLFGCCEKCPFCSAPCLEQTKDHCISGSPHHSLHYPIGVRGAVVHKGVHEANRIQSHRSQSKSQEGSFSLVIKWCPLLIQSDGCFRSDHTKDRYNRFYHRWFSWDYGYYQSYRKEFPDWLIPHPADMEPDANKYWKWLLAKFSTQFAEHYHAECPEFSPWWHRISRGRAVRSIIKLLQNYDKTNT